MKATISLKQLRTDPEAITRLLNNGYQVDITKHRKPLATALPPRKHTPKPEPDHTVANLLKTINSLPPLENGTPYPDMGTVELIKQTRMEGYEAKRRKLNS
jgi:hypothetical protein